MEHLIHCGGKTGETLDGTSGKAMSKTGET